MAQNMRDEAMKMLFRFDGNKSLAMARQREKIRVKPSQENIEILYYLSRITSTTAGGIKINAIKREYENSKIALGHKSTAYYDTEEEMINGFSCTYEQLSDSEKRMYNGR